MGPAPHVPSARPARHSYAIPIAPNWFCRVNLRTPRHDLCASASPPNFMIWCQLEQLHEYRVIVRYSRFTPKWFN